MLVMLSSSVVPAMAASDTTDGILLKRVVVASMDEKVKLQLNVTGVNQLIDFGNVTCGNCSCSRTNGTCPVTPYSADINEIYNVSENGKMQADERDSLQRNVQLQLLRAGLPG